MRLPRNPGVAVFGQPLQVLEITLAHYQKMYVTVLSQ